MSDGEWSATELDRVGRALLGPASDAIVVADRDGLIRFWNPGAERIFGFPAAEALGQSLDIIIPEPQRARHWAGFQRVMETGESRYGAGELLAVPGLRGDGDRISLEFTIVPLHAPDGQMEGMAAILRDVTRRFEEVRALRRELAEIRKRTDPPG
ncbi:PAS domain S-box protein [Sabulicella rubraurantiaca]|uniref:PAS domain S-box protein n=1 Tax=Sabulicella rubraurantiaca TaxID=2811429 RepID=UPI001A97CAE7|nr:PAS domain S-box protein [Sabulicella rubraurantiaca]